MLQFQFRNFAPNLKREKYREVLAHIYFPRTISITVLAAR